MVGAFHAAHNGHFGYDYAGDSQKIELVNFCVSGFGLIRRPEIQRHPLSDDRREASAQSRSRPVYFDGADGFVETPVLWRPRPGRRARSSRGRPSSRSSAPRSLHPGFTARVDEFRNLIVTRAAPVDERSDR